MGLFGCNGNGDNWWIWLLIIIALVVLCGGCLLYTSDAADEL